MNMPDFALSIRTLFQPAYSTSTYHKFLVLLLGALLTTGRQTIPNVLRTVRPQALGHASAYHRVFSRRRWFPERQFIFVGDTGYGPSETARFCHTHCRHLTLISKFYGLLHLAWDLLR